GTRTARRGYQSVPERCADVGSDRDPFRPRGHVVRSRQQRRLAFGRNVARSRKPTAVPTPLWTIPGRASPRRVADRAVGCHWGRLSADGRGGSRAAAGRRGGHGDAHGWFAAPFRSAGWRGRDRLDGACFGTR